MFTTEMSAFGPSGLTRGSIYYINFNRFKTELWIKEDVEKYKTP